MKLWKKLAALLAMFIAFNVNAALIDNGNYTTDTETGLDWLDLTDSINLSHNDMVMELEPGGQFEGWTYANSEQLESLFNSAGGNGNYIYDVTDVSVQSFTVVTELLALWGATYNFDGMGALFYYPDPSWVNGPLAIGVVDVGYGPGVIYLQYFEGNPDTSGSLIGHALVRPTVIPAPPAAWLFMSGLLGLVSIIRRPTESSNLIHEQPGSDTSSH